MCSVEGTLANAERRQRWCHEVKPSRPYRTACFLVPPAQEAPIYSASPLPEIHAAVSSRERGSGPHATAAQEPSAHSSHRLCTQHSPHTMCLTTGLGQHRGLAWREALPHHWRYGKGAA
eukprot:5455643-Pleurochrysis_carterae.AAC.1